MKATVVKSVSGCLDVILYEHGHYERPLAILTLADWSRLNAAVESDVKVHKFKEDRKP